MKWSRVILYLLFLLCGAGLVACAGCVEENGTSGDTRFVDSLNHLAYTLRYKDLDASAERAEQAYRLAASYNKGKAEACNNRGFAAFMRMDFEEAERRFREVYGLTKNELELLVADVGLMKIYQRTALNKEFYDYRNSALRRMKRIDEEQSLFDNEQERMRLEFARSEFYIVSAIYYYYLQQRPEAVASIDCVEEKTVSADTAQLLYYHYIKGAAALCEGESADARRLHEFDQLYLAWLLSSQKGYPYFEGNSLQGLANLMVTPDAYEFFLNRRSYALTQLDTLAVDSLLPLRLAGEALKKFRRYNDLYQIAGAYVSIGKYLNAHGRYREALDTLTIALECVNEHHRRYYDCHDTLDWLKPYAGSIDSICVEKSWMEQALKTVPEWISRIREQLSVSYAGLEMKEESDYNRNVYLDILEDTRQDKELESRYEALEAENRQLNVVFSMVVAGVIGASLLFVFVNRRSKRRNRRELQRLQLLLDICRKITASIPADAREEEEIVAAIHRAIDADLCSLFGYEGIGIADGELTFPHKPDKESQAIAHVINPYIRWTLDNGMASITLTDERRRLEKQRYIHEQHIAINKRRNIDKKACVAIVDGIKPYIDRIMHEVSRLSVAEYAQDAVVKAGKYQYIDELVSIINEYNDILALWVRMKQGTLNLNIETFGLGELFDLIRKGGRAFEMKQQHLEVTATDAWVKADKALTLFMINTLTENARKYTARGGRIKLYARSEKEFVEVSVEDNGCGLSEEDVAHILREKLYDSKEIGLADAADKEELLKNKGSGFGLMNCKGIIEKYRKTSDLFKVCLFGIESRVGQGSRFYFRLPIGIKRTAMMLCLILSLASCSSCHHPLPAPEEGDASSRLPALQTLQERIDSEELLDVASDFANEAYFCNVDGDYESALQCIDSAIVYLNNHYKRYADKPTRLMALTGEEEAAELDWWNSTFNTDFHVILDIRNEAAVALLALKQWDAYYYNNSVYTSLYKLLGEDQSLEEYCRRLERSKSNKQVGILLIVCLLFVSVLSYYLFYLRKRLQSRWDLEQVFEINRDIFKASQLPASPEEEEALQREEDTLKRIPRQVVETMLDATNELLNRNVTNLILAVGNSSTGSLDYTVARGTLPPSAEQRVLMERCYERETGMTDSPGCLLALPLVADVGEKSRCVGVLCIEHTEGNSREADRYRLLLELTARYVAVVILNAVVTPATKYRDIDTACDEARRAAWEDSQLHVQNLVLDNCLSTIKHETIYYPNKIKQLIGKLRSSLLTVEEEREHIAAIGELIEYYRGVFTLLSRCASRQLEDTTFRRSRVAVDEIMAAATRYINQADFKKNQADSYRKSGQFLQTISLNSYVVCDRTLVTYLLENLIDEARSVSGDGKLILSAGAEGDFVCFRFTDTRRHKSREELNRLFYPELARMTCDDGGHLKGTEYLVCKQIVRDHDEYAGRRGCRINAEPAPEGGFTVYFTLPVATQRT